MASSRSAQHEIRGNPAPLLASFVARIDRLKDELVTAEEYRTYAEGLVAAAEQDGDAARATAARELEFAGIYADHDRLLAERGALDFGDLVMRAFRLLHERPHVRERAVAALPARARGRVPGHELRPGDAARACWSTRTAT